MRGASMITYLVDSVLREERLGLLVADRGVDDNVVALLPVDRRRDTVLVTDLQSYKHAISTRRELRGAETPMHAQSMTRMISSKLRPVEAG